MSLADDPLIPETEFRRRLGGIHRETRRRWVRRGLIPAPIEINGRLYYRASTAETLAERGKTDRAEAAA